MRVTGSERAASARGVRQRAACTPIVRNSCNSHNLNGGSASRPRCRRYVRVCISDERVSCLLMSDRSVADAPRKQNPRMRVRGPHDPPHTFHTAHLQSDGDFLRTPSPNVGLAFASFAKKLCSMYTCRRNLFLVGSQTGKAKGRLGGVAHSTEASLARQDGR